MSINSDFLLRQRLTLPKDQLQARSHTFLQRQLEKNEEEVGIVGSYLGRHQILLSSLETVQSPEVNLVDTTHITCDKCGQEFGSIGSLRRHIVKSHEGDSCH